MTSLVKSYPNAYLDMCWLPWLLYENLTKYLSEWLSVLPCNKIMVSGDAECVERAYSAFFFAKKCFAHVLSDHIEKGYYSKKTAIDIAKKIFRKNAQNVYNMISPNN
jgi:predicted TIM-barrel fold metal-dependent hydrolase